MKLLIKSMDNDGRLAPLEHLLTTPWEIEVVDDGDRSGFAAALQHADAIVSMNWPGDYPPSRTLRLIHLPGAGLDGIEFSSVPEQATVCNAFEHEIGIAEYVLAAMLEWLIGMRRLDASFRAGSWRGSYLCGPRHGDLSGATLAILGYGRIGREVAKRAHAFGVRVVAASRTPGPGDEWCEGVRPMNALREVVSDADFVLVTLPLDDSTRGIVDAATLAAMKPDAVIINVGRGATVDEDALFEALLKRSIGGAVIDTWYRYPAQQDAGTSTVRPSRHPFHELDNLIMTPHACAWTHALAERRCRIIASNLDRLARGEPLVNVVREPRRETMT
ncbi:MAG: hypothetical protein GC151_12645 [Betaproteobacteria bacterium]|nr:hypothetical protein [Betaproteobacteria bacterium]